MQNQKPITDLQRIQQSYSSGSQKYVPSSGSATAIVRPKSEEDLIRDAKSEVISRAQTL